MPLPALALPIDLHLFSMATAQAQEPQILEPQILTPNNPNVIAPTNLNAPRASSRYRTFFEGYFDAGASDLIGLFSTQVLRYVVRSGQHDVHAFLRNETLDTTGTNLPFRAIVQGTGAGVGYRYWFPGNKLFANAQYARIFAGTNEGRDDVRVGLAGFTSNLSDRWFSDVYGDFYYIDLAKDTFISARVRNGIVLRKNTDGILSTYIVGQAFGSGKGQNGTENRIETGIGLGYTFTGLAGGRAAVSANLELRVGYAYRGRINERSYFNPQFVISGGF